MHDYVWSAEPPVCPYHFHLTDRYLDTQVDAIRKLNVVRKRDVKGSRHLLFFAYAVTMKAVIQELDYLGRTLQDAFGVIGQSREAFENLFEAPTSLSSANQV